jgi:DNA polymerase-3 subunit delta'
MILGHQKQIAFLKKILNSGKIPHALLFSGQEKLGKRTIALEFASWILKENPLLHPDFLLVEPKTEVIQIDQIRRVNYHLSLTPFKSKYKIVILDSAHLMTKDSQNCFLKTLEEPRGNSIIILITPFPEILLSTILSRCQEIKFFPLKREEIENFLRQKKIENKEKLLEICQGRPGILFEILEDPKRLKEIEKIEKTIEKFPQMLIFEKFNFLKNVNLDQFLETLIFHFRKKIFDENSKKAIKILKKAQYLQILNLRLKVDKKMALEILSLEI